MPPVWGSPDPGSLPGGSTTSSLLLPSSPLPAVDNLDPNFQSDQQSKRTPLHAAAQKGSVEICHVLLQVSHRAPRPVQPSPPPQHPSLVPALVPSPQAGANINAVDKQQRTPLMEAVVNNHLEVARYMVQLGGCVYSKVEELEGSPAAGGAEGGKTGCGCQPEGSLAHVSLRRRMAPPVSIMQPKLGTWRWSACC